MNWRRIVVVMTMGMLLLQLAEVQADPCAKEADGCSVPFNLYTPFKTRFTPSCNRHDVCYSCGSKYGINRRRCDRAFLGDMRDACKGTFPFFLLCRTKALKYFTAVRLFSSSHYGGNDSYCHESWVPKCLPRRR